MADAPIRIGVLGAGWIAPLALIEPARSRDDVTVATVAARDPDRARAFANEHGLEDASASYDAVIARDDIDLVYVALPPDLHRRWTLAALAGGKAVLCEKPFALDAGEARAMVEAARRAGKPLLEAFHYRFHRLMHEAVKLMREGAIGTPLRAAAHVAYPIPRRPGQLRWSAEHGGGALLDLGCYGMHALRSLLGTEPHIVSAEARCDGGVDAETRAMLRFGAVEAALSCAMDPPEPAAHITVEGSEGVLDIAGFVLPQRAGRLRLTRGGETEELPVAGPSSYAAQLDHVVQVLRGTEQPMTGGDDAIANMAALDAIRVRSRG